MNIIGGAVRVSPFGLPQWGLELTDRVQSKLKRVALISTLNTERKKPGIAGAAETLT